MNQDAERKHWLESELDTIERTMEDLTGKIDALSLAEQDLFGREHRLQLDLETALHPRTLYRDKRPADVAIELGQVRAGIAELGRYKRDLQRELQTAQHRQQTVQGDLDRHAAEQPAA